MKQQNKLFTLTSISFAVMVLMSQTAAAEDNAAAQAGAAKTPESTAAQSEVQQVVVTGSAQGKGLRKIDAAYSITTANEEQIKEANPVSTADLFKIVPGVFAETSGGQAGANIEVAGFPGGGDAPYVTIQVNGAPLFPSPSLSFLENSSLFRLDDTVDHMEALIGGPNTVLSNGQTGATMNFILKTGEEGNDGLLRTTFGTGNLRRYDGYYGGKIADGWYGMIGGFYRTDNGVRDSQFPTDDGYQLTASLTRKLDQGKLTIYGRTLNDKNLFFTGLPLSYNAASGVSAFPGLDPLKASLYGNENRFVNIPTAPGQYKQIDMANGRGANVNLFGVDFGQKVAGWDVSNKLNYLSGSTPTYALFTGNQPLSMSQYISNAITRANANSAAVAAGGLASAGTASYVDGSGMVDPNQQVIQAGAWSVEKNIRSTTDEFKISKELIKDHTTTFGVFLADYSSSDRWYLGNSMLMTATSNARPINVTLNNGAVIASNGLDGASFYSVNNAYTGRKTALFLADQWKVNDRLTVDAGLRSERQTINATEENLSTMNLDSNPLHLYNQNASVLNGTYTSVNQSDTATSFTVGGAYKLNHDTSVFVRANSGHLLPQFDDIRGTNPNSGNRAPVQDIKTIEVGIKHVSQQITAYVSVFHKDFSGILASQILADGTSQWYNYGSTTNGINFEGAWRPFAGFQLAVSGDYEDGQYKDFRGADAVNNGLTLQRQPKFQARVTPSYRLPTDWGSIRLYGTYSYIGKRFSDIQNTQVLPSYSTLDAGLLAEVGEKLEFRLSGTNLTNTLGLTEGNARIIGSTTGTVIARPVFGRAVEASVTYRF